MMNQKFSKALNTLAIATLCCVLQVNAQNKTDQKPSTTQFSEMTSLDQFGGPSSGTYRPSSAERQRIAWWRDAKFGMFMHWGLYSQMAGYWKGELVRGGEWAVKMNKLPIENS